MFSPDLRTKARLGEVDRGPGQGGALEHRPGARQLP